MKDLQVKGVPQNLLTTKSFRCYTQLDSQFWGDRGEKQGRNDKCRCGSGKKYKKCCYSKTSSTSGRESVLKLMTGGSLGKQLNPDGFVPYVMGWKDLKNDEFNERFLEFLKQYPVLTGGCFFNAFKLMYEMRDLGVEQVHGWYGFDVQTCVEFDSFVERYLDGKRGMEYVYDNSDKSESSYWPGYDSVWDYDKGLVWKRHAWNKLNGVHFDTTRETMNREWVYYNEVFSQDWSDLLFSQSDNQKVPNVFKTLQHSVQGVTTYLDETLQLKGKKEKRNREVLDFQFG